MLNPGQYGEVVSNALTILLEDGFPGVAKERNANNLFAHNILHHYRSLGIHRKADN